MNEDRLNQLAQRLGADTAERLDVDVRIAATVVILVGGAVALRQVRIGRDSAEHIPHFVADDLSDLSADELREVLTSFDEIVAGDSVVVPESGTDLNELDTQQLRALLRSPEG